jgi:cation diffusion facilitator CzcD-associated flavoprotein CzcO
VSPQPCAIVGGGLVGLTAYAALRDAGLEPGEIAVFGDHPDPAAVWSVRASSIRQRHMRSESDGHCLPATFPGLAVRTALRRRSPVPLLLSICDRYHPTVEEFLDHVAEVRARSGWDASFRRDRIERIRALDGGFELDAKGVFSHVLISVGHPGLAFPAELEGDPRVVHAYEPHEYAAEVAVVGAGMAAATEWLNALAAGSSVVSVRRREPERRPLNLSRSMFTRRGLAAFHAASREERAALLRRFSVPSYPPGRVWDEPLERATREGRFWVASDVDGAPQLICATGFRKGFQASPLLFRLAEEHGLDTVDGWIVLDPDSTVPGLTDARRTLALAGAHGQWAFPASDTLAGARYVAHRFVRRVKQWRTP